MPISYRARKHARFHENWPRRLGGFADTRSVTNGGRPDKDARTNVGHFNRSNPPTSGDNN